MCIQGVVGVQEQDQLDLGIDHVKEMIYVMIWKLVLCMIFMGEKEKSNIEIQQVVNEKL